ncbi:MAG: plasmid stabilization protein [Desulfobulbaceae bacterium S3730MH12]|nr:MAG: plasmid stabilization protein [Desulfobulbaceae bacterium S5133MH15]OEU58482.1 MAG: plasmid stabilization protein [Desulfobulbaceae bacterium S3730MH12]OEU78759.1 MAG: plasmid stabilization protein [Desulfobulbaceae bacterium C00003063]
MSYTVKIKRQAKHKLKSLGKKDRLRITDVISSLGVDPDDVMLDTKQLTGSRLWRLRVGGWRIIYDRQDYMKIIMIEKIKPRGDAYK